MIDYWIDLLDWVDGTTDDTVLSGMAILLVVGYLMIEAVFVMDKIQRKRQDR